MERADEIGTSRLQRNALIGSWFCAARYFDCAWIHCGENVLGNLFETAEQRGTAV